MAHASPPGYPVWYKDNVTVSKMNENTIPRILWIMLIFNGNATICSAASEKLKMGENTTELLHTLPNSCGLHQNGTYAESRRNSDRVSGLIKFASIVAEMMRDTSAALASPRPSRSLSDLFVIFLR
jgi:hypothetical protein